MTPTPMTTEREDEAGYKLPCDVHIPPNTFIRKGCDLETLMVGIRAREKFPAESVTFPRSPAPAGAGEAEKLAARACYEKWIEAVADLEPTWDELPPDHKERLHEAFAAGLAALRRMTQLPEDVKGLADKIAPILYQYFVKDCLSEATVQMTETAAKKLAPILLAHANSRLAAMEHRAEAAEADWQASDARVAVLEEALRFYAAEDSYDDNGAPFTVGQEQGQEYERIDIGDKARAALSTGAGEEKR